MEPMIFRASFVVAALAAAIMGFAIQRGATCTVAAVDEIISKRSGKKLWAMVEAALWVALGLALAQRLHWLGALPEGYALNVWTLVGAVFLGFGAWVNKACVFGSVARLGSGEWAHAATPLGFFIGCLSMSAIFGVLAPSVQPSESLMQFAASGALIPLTVILVWRVYARFWRKGGLADTRDPVSSGAIVWSPHVATVIIGFMFLATSILAGNWAYTDVLAQLAHGMTTRLYVGALMALALLAGAMVGGYTAGRLRWHPVAITSVARCFAGGILMAWGSLMVPGGNDGLILIGMPLLWPYAWVAFFVMCLTVAAAQITVIRIASVRLPARRK